MLQAKVGESAVPICANDITDANFASIILDEAKRSELLSAIKAETGANPPLINRVLMVGRQFETTTDELDEIVDIEVHAQQEDLLYVIVFHPLISEAALFKVYDAQLCVVELAHRSGPFELLQRIAREHRVEEAVMTLLLGYYSNDNFSNEAFISFLEEYGDIHGVHYLLRNKSLIPEAKRQLGLQVLDNLSN